MKSLYSIILVGLFVIGALIIPAIHRAHCADDHVAQESSPCYMCQLATSPLRLSPGILPLRVDNRVVDTIVHEPLTVSQDVPLAATGARAPPA